MIGIFAKIEDINAKKGPPKNFLSGIIKNNSTLSSETKSKNLEVVQEADE